MLHRRDEFLSAYSELGTPYSLRRRRQQIHSHTHSPKKSLLKFPGYGFFLLRGFLLASARPVSVPPPRAARHDVFGRFPFKMACSFPPDVVYLLMEKLAEIFISIRSYGGPQLSEHLDPSWRSSGSSSCVIDDSGTKYTAPHAIIKIVLSRAGHSPYHLIAGFLLFKLFLCFSLSSPSSPPHFTCPSLFFVVKKKNALCVWASDFLYTGFGASVNFLCTN